MILVYTDGAAKGDPGISGAGVFIKSGDEHLEYSIPLGILSNHEAEFHAVLQALKICRKEFPASILSFRSDSKLVVDTIEKDYTKNTIYRSLLEQIREEAKHFPHFFIKWIPEKQNANADKLARKALYLE